MAYFDYEATLNQLINQQIRELLAQREEARQELRYQYPNPSQSDFDSYDFYNEEVRRRIQALEEFKRKLKSKKKIKPSCKTSTTLNKLFEDGV